MDPEDKIYKLDEARCLISSAIDLVEEIGDDDDTISFLEIVEESFKRRIEALEKLQMNKWRKETYDY